MSKDIFFSYSWRDMPIAMRIYQDLIRNGISVWRDEFSAVVGKEYTTEISNALDECKGVLLLDSPNSRNSKYVKEEWKQLCSKEKWRSGDKRIVICMIADALITQGEPVLFEGHNGNKYIDFSRCSQLFDNDRSYLLAITELCEIFGVTFQSAYPDTTEKDFEDELSKFNIKDLDRTILFREYELIQYRLINGFPRTLERLEMFANECIFLQLDCPSPQLQLAIELAKTAEYTRSKKILLTYTDNYPDDPRGWRVLASSFFELKEFPDALAAYDKTIELMLKIKDTPTSPSIRFNNLKNLEYMTVSRINRATTMYLIEKYQDAFREFESILNDHDLRDQLLPDYYMLVVDIFENEKLNNAREKWINNGLDQFPGDYQLNLAKARWLFEINNLYQSLLYYEYLVKREISNLKIFAEYITLLKILTLEKQFSYASEEAFAISPGSDEELYYYGYVLFLNRQIDQAKEYFLKSNYRELPWYEIIWNGQTVVKYGKE